MENLLKGIRFSIVVLFTFVNIFLLVLNWKMFTTSQIINLGFGQITAAPAVLELVIGGLFIFLFWLTMGSNETLKKEITLGEQKIINLEQENKEIRSAIETLEDQIAEYKDFKISSNKEEEAADESINRPRMTFN